MPYITKERRIELDPIVRQMAAGRVMADGDLSYILFAFCKHHVIPRYNNYKNFCGELHQCATEIERRLVGPYEDSVMHVNGDIE